MYKNIFITIAFFLLSAITFGQEFKKLTGNGFVSNEPNSSFFEIPEQDINYQFAINGKSAVAHMNIGFKNYSSWEKLKLTNAALQDIINGAIKSIGDSVIKFHNVSIRLSKVEHYDSWMIAYNVVTTPKTLVSNLQGATSIAKLGFDTLVIYERSGDDNQYGLVYQIVANSIADLGDDFWEDAAQGSRKITEKLQPIAMSKKPDALFRERTGALYWDKEKGYTFETNNSSWVNALSNKLIIAADIGPYWGIANISTNVDVLVAYSFANTDSRAKPYIGLNYGSLNTKIANDKMFADQYIGIEFGAIIKPNSGIIQGNRASLVLGMFNANLENGYDKEFFKQKPQFYMGLKYPIWKHVQLTLHLSSKFKSSNIDYNKYLFGISTNISLGSLFR